MVQILVPVADIAVNSWTTADLFSKVDDDSTVSPSGDGTVITSDAVGNNVNTSDADLEGPTSGVTDPAVSTGHILRVRWNSSLDRDMTGHFELWQGVPDTGSLLADATVELTTTTEVETTLTLSAGEADSITDYNDLHFRLWGRGTGGGPDRSLVVDLCELEVPEGAVTVEVVGASVAVAEDSAAPAQTHLLNGAPVAVAEADATPVQVHKLDCPETVGGFSSGFSSGFAVGSGGSCVTAVVEVTGVLTVVAVHALVGAAVAVAAVSATPIQTHVPSGAVVAVAQVAGSVVTVVDLVGAAVAVTTLVATPIQVHTADAAVVAVAVTAGVLTVGEFNELIGGVVAVVAVVGILTEFEGLAGAVSAVVEVDGSALTVDTGAAVFVGWGIPIGV